MKAILHMHDFIGELPESIKHEFNELSFRRRVSKGEVVYSKDDLNTELYRIKSGVIKLCNYSLDGDEIITGEFRTGDCFGEMSLVDGLPRVSHAVASEDSELSVLLETHFNALREKYREVDRALNLVLCRRVRALYSLNQETVGLKLIERLARSLHRLAYSQGEQEEWGGVAIRVSHEELSKMLGASRQSVSKELKNLEKEGDITLDYGKICIPELEQLARKYEAAIGMEQVTARYQRATEIT